MTMKSLLFLQCLFISIGLCLGQNSQNGTGRERGLVFTVTAKYDDTIHLVHLPFMPYYEPIRRPLSVPGWQFRNPELDFLSVDVDFRDKTLFLFERDSRSIMAVTGYKAPVTEGLINGPIYYLMVGVSNGAVQISYDWLSKTLYWTDSALGWIMATTGNMTKLEVTEFVNFNLYKIIIKDDLDHPEGIAVDPLAGFLFFSENGKHTKIERAQLDGSNRITLLSSGVGIPESMEVDVVAKKVYWVDKLKQTIEYMNYDGSDPARVRLISGSQLVDLAIFRDLLVAVDENRGRAYFLNKTSGKDLISSIEFKKDYMYGVCVYNIEHQPLKHYAVGKSCSELDCEHMCVSTQSNPKCLCYEGFRLNSTNTCEETAGSTHRAIVIALDRSICVADIRAFNDISPYFGLNCVFKSTLLEHTKTTTGPNSNTTSAPYDPNDDPDNIITMIDLNIPKRVVYFATAANSIYRRPLDLTIDNPFREIILKATGNITGMVFDWVNKNNLYWMESVTNNLNVVDLTTGSLSNLTSLGTGTLSNLVMLYRERRLAWWMKDETSKMFTLKTAGLNGQDVKTVVSNRADVKSLAVDDDKELFYWIEGSLIKKAAFNITSDDHIASVTQTMYNGFEILLQYKNLLMWAYPTSEGTFLESYNRDVGTPGASGTFGTFDQFVGIKILDIALTPEDITKKNPCSYQNGNCEQICTVKYSVSSAVKQCGCTLGFTLNNDGKRCDSDFVEEKFALVVDATYKRIYQINLVTDDLHALNYRESALYNSVLYDRMNRDVIWSESIINSVYSAKLNGTDFRIRDSKAYGDPGEFALDETTGNLYYAENNWPYDGIIRALTPQGFGFKFIENTLRYQDYISAIAVIPLKGWLYIGVTSGIREAYVLRSNLDGTNIQRFNLTTPPVQHPILIGLAIDHSTEEIYYTEGSQDKIYKCDLHFEACALFFVDTGTNIRHIDTDGEYLYYTSYSAHHLKRLKISDKTLTELGKTIKMGKLDSVSVYKMDSKSKQKVSDPCKNRNGRGDCSTICFPTEMGRTCACEYNITLLADQRTCSNVHQCEPTFLEVSTNRQISLVPNCLRYVNESCDYTCPGLFAPIANHRLTCFNDGWDRRSRQLCRSVPCSNTIQNGRMAMDCPYALNQPCNFTCNQGYYKYPNINSLICKQDGSWHSDDDNQKQPCTDLLCPMSLTNGAIEDQCDRRLGSACSYNCKTNYKKTTNKQSLVCEMQSGGQAQWDQTSGLCEEIVCPKTVDSGVIVGTCTRKFGSVCSFTCPGQFIKSKTVSEVKCTDQGVWNQSTDLCISPAPTVAQSQTSNTNRNVGIGVGVGFLVLATIVLVVLAVVCRGRLGRCGKKEEDMPSAAFTNDPINGIENPGYLTAGIRVTNDTDNGYEQPTTSSNPNYKKDDPYSTISDKGTVRSGNSFYYGNETLPDKKEIESPKVLEKDTTYLTADSWLKQQNAMHGKY